MLWLRHSEREASQMSPDGSANLSDETEGAIHISNAGLILTSPFLPHLFLTLGMVEDDDNGRCVWRNKQDSMRAVHILQYLTDERTSAPEPQLILNKILCGLLTSAPVGRVIELTEQEVEVCGQLLNAMIANWTMLSNSTEESLRETFLQREGRLICEGSIWKLCVQRKAFDVLLDQISWNFTTVSHDWMPLALQVNW